MKIGTEGKQGDHQLTSSIQWNGIIPDIVESLAELLNFTYTLHLARDGKWGAKVT